MTTNTQHTPYDTWAHNAKTSALKEGYLRAKAEDAPLLEAAKDALLWMEDSLFPTDVSGIETRMMLRAAIAWAKGGAA